MTLYTMEYRAGISDLKEKFMSRNDNTAVNKAKNILRNKVRAGYIQPPPILFMVYRSPEDLLARAQMIGKNKNEDRDF